MYFKSLLKSNLIATSYMATDTMSIELQENSPKTDGQMSQQETPKRKAGLDYMTVGVSMTHIAYINDVLKVIRWSCTTTTLSRRKR